MNRRNPISKSAFSYGTATTPVDSFTDALKDNFDDFFNAINTLENQVHSIEQRLQGITQQALPFSIEHLNEVKVVMRINESLNQFSGYVSQERVNFVDHALEQIKRIQQAGEDLIKTAIEKEKKTKIDYLRFLLPEKIVIETVGEAKVVSIFRNEKWFTCTNKNNQKWFKILGAESLSYNFITTENTTEYTKISTDYEELMFSLASDPF